MIATSWQVAGSLDRLLEQLDGLAPRRSRAADGSIGDPDHATRDSDHNPWLVLAGQRLVTARDFTHDPRGGLDGARLAAALAGGRDRRVKYLIWNRRIMAGAAGPAPWTWRTYTGANPHTGHLHLSVVADIRCRDRGTWQLPGLAAAPSAGDERPTIRRGDHGPAVELIQRFLDVAGPGDPGYGQFGPATEAAVRRYQQMRALRVDGVVGPATWRETGL